MSRFDISVSCDLREFDGFVEQPDVIKYKVFLKIYDREYPSSFCVKDSNSLAEHRIICQRIDACLNLLIEAVGHDFLKGKE